VLVFKRSVSERIIIGDDIEIVLTEICGRRSARIGVKAPKGVRVDREEVRDAIERDRNRGIVAKPGDVE